MVFHAASPGDSQSGQVTPALVQFLTSTQHVLQRSEKKEITEQGGWEWGHRANMGCIFTARSAFGWSTLIWVCLHITRLHCLTFLLPL